MSLDRPYSFGIDIANSVLERYDNHIRRTLSSMRGQYFDTAAYDKLLAQEDHLLYQVYEMQRPHTSGEVWNGLSVLHPGKVGNEYHMTKGHFHAVLETGEVYHCLKGEGMLVMETPEGDWDVQPLRAGENSKFQTRNSERLKGVVADKQCTCPASRLMWERYPPAPPI